MRTVLQGTYLELGGGERAGLGGNGRDGASVSGDAIFRSKYLELLVVVGPSQVFKGLFWLLPGTWANRTRE